MDPSRLSQLSLKILCGVVGLVLQHRLLHHHERHGAQPTLADTVPHMDLGLWHVCLGGLEPPQLWHAGQLPAADHDRLRGHVPSLDAVTTPPI